MPSCWIQALASEKMDKTRILLQRLLRTEHRWAALVGRGQSEVVHQAVTGVREPRTRSRIAGCRRVGHAGRGGNSQGPRRRRHVQTIHAFVAARMRFGGQ